MQIYAINGSPRKKWNTGQVLQSVLDGAAETGADVLTEMIDLYALSYKGCISCFECKRIGGPSYGKCAVKDDLHPVLEKIAKADALVLGTPIYFSDITGQMHCFLERLLFQYLEYSPNYPSLAPKKMPTAFVYTMNVPRQTMDAVGYPKRLQAMEGFVGHCFGQPTQVLYVCDTYQFRDYGKYKCDVFDAQEKAKVKEEQFPRDLSAARKLGQALANDAMLTSGEF